MNDELLCRELEAFLLQVTTPGQYIGGEWNQSCKPDAEIECRIALAFPDTYPVGMSHHGLRVLYEVCNQIPGIAAERAFTPLPDMEKALRERGLPLFTLETKTPLFRCDLVGFSLQYEMAASNILTMLELGGIPILARDRTEEHPLIIAGGIGSMNPEPLADFIDLFLIGEGEEALPELLAACREEPFAGRPRRERLAALVRRSSGWYAPALYARDQTGRLRPLMEGVPETISRRVVDGFATLPHPLLPIVPVIETTHERITLEVMRGCPWGCRFCQAGMVSRPVRARPVKALVEAAEICYARTGYDEIGLLSLSTSDYPDFPGLVSALDQVFAPRGVGLSLPSLRVNTALKGIPDQVNSVRKGAFTLAPEAGTERLRAVVNKAVTDEDLLAGAEAAFKAGWNGIKLYFMIGLPTETDEDILAIPDLAARVAHLRRGRGRGPSVSLSVSNFVPKSHTPFQWEAMADGAELRRRQGLIAGRVNRKLISYKAHDVSLSLLEGAIARGGREMGAVIRSAWEEGARLCAWGEHLHSSAWDKAFADHGLTPERVACQRRNLQEILPWEHIDGGVSRRFLAEEYDKSLRLERTPPCSQEYCSGCGVKSCLWCRGEENSGVGR